MKTTIRFEHIFKQYRLGLTRTSLPSIISGWFQHSLKRTSNQSPQEKQFWALHDVSFELKQGESLALVGSNGAGKTTILKLLANITRPTSGSIHIDGRLSALIELGAGFHPDLTGRENIYLNGSILGLSRRQIAGHFDEIVAFSELEQFIDTPVKRYSSGMAVRLGFAVASCIEPEILLVDEVLAVGDVSFQQKCLQRIHLLISGGTSIIFVSHNFYLVQAVCRTALYLEKGQMKHFGETKEIIDHYEEDLQRAKIQRSEISDPNRYEGHAVNLEITKVEVWDEEGPASDSIPNSHSVQIRIHYNALSAAGRVQVSVFIRRSDGLTCCSMRTRLDGYEVSLGTGKGIVSVRLDSLQLVSGTYFAEAGFLNESDSMVIIDKLGRSDWFLVKGQGLSYDSNNGVFEPHAIWSHHAG